MRKSALVVGGAAGAFLFVCQSVALAGGWESDVKACRDLLGETALEACNKALATMPGDLPPDLVGEIHRNRGIVFGQLGRTEEAVHELELAAKLAPKDAKTQYNLGVAYEEAGHDWFALRCYRKATTLDPGMVSAWGNQAMAAYRTDRYREAHQAFEAVDQLDPSYLDSRPEQRAAWEETMKVKPASVAARREVNVRFTPSVGTFVGLDKTISPYIRTTTPIFLDTEVDVQLYRYLFAVASFAYGHTLAATIPSGQSMSTNFYGIGVGLKLASNEEISDPFLTFMDRARFWFEAEVGPAISTGSITLTAANLATGASETKASLGVNGGVGFEYYLIPNFALGLNIRLHYVALDVDNYVILSGGPCIIGRF